MFFRIIECVLCGGGITWCLIKPNMEVWNDTFPFYGPWRVNILLSIVSIHSHSSLVVSAWSDRICAVVHRSLLDMLGYFSMSTSAGMLVYLPGGLFELFLPIWLFIKGFNVSKSACEFTAAKRWIDRLIDIFAHYIGIHSVLAYVYCDSICQPAQFHALANQYEEGRCKKKTIEGDGKNQKCGRLTSPTLSGLSEAKAA